MEPVSGLQNQRTDRRFRLYEHPWLSLLAVVVSSVFAIYLSAVVIFGLIGLPDDVPVVQLAQGLSYHILTGFVLAPFVLHLPKGRRTFKQYLDDIGLSRVRPVSYTHLTLPTN